MVTRISVLLLLFFSSSPSFVLASLLDSATTTCETSSSTGECAGGVKDVSEVCFVLARNGDGDAEHGIPLCAKDFTDVDDLIAKHCWQVIQDEVNSPHLKESQCVPGEGARLFTHSGVRVLQFSDILKDERVYVVPQGLQFEWPLVKPGNIIIPRNVESPIPDRPLRLTQLSNKPRVFQVENFISDEEVKELIEKNEKRLTPSEVGFAGWVDNEGTRTSYTAWDDRTKASASIRKRTFEILGVDFDVQLADALQVLRYVPGQWYKPHTDYFDEDGFDGSDPTVNNGTNRFATMFLYLSTVEEGGHTVFPHSTTHIGYNGEELVHEGTIDTAGYIDTKDAKWCCNTSSTALRSTPVKGNAVLFYSQMPDGTLDPYSLHGGCPPIKGIKWSGNVWIWNRPSPDKSVAKDKPPEDYKDPKQQHAGITVRFANSMPGVTMNLVWDPNFGDEPDDGSDAKSHFVDQGTIKPGKMQPIDTYEGHTFHILVDNEIKYTYVAKKEDDDARVPIKW